MVLLRKSGKQEKGRVQWHTTIIYQNIEEQFKVTHSNGGLEYVFEDYTVKNTKNLSHLNLNYIKLS